MVRPGDQWICRSDKEPWQVTEVRGDLATLRSRDGTLITLPELELRDGWMPSMGGDTFDATELSRAIHEAMIWAMAGQDRGSPEYYETVTARLQKKLAESSLPPWMAPDFWSVEADTSLPNHRAHRVIPTVLIGKRVSMEVEWEPAPSYTARVNDLFVRADNPVMAIAGLARLVKSRGN